MNQFLDPTSNNKSEEYGGSIENRAQFTLEVVDASIAAVGVSGASIRLYPYGTYFSLCSGADSENIALFAYVLSELEKRAREENDWHTYNLLNRVFLTLS